MVRSAKALPPAAGAAGTQVLAVFLLPQALALRIECVSGKMRVKAVSGRMWKPFGTTFAPTETLRLGDISSDPQPAVLLLPPFLRWRQS